MRNKTLILYKKSWICGDPQSNEVEGNFLGYGDTCMLNDKNQSCCLGQWLRQQNPDEVGDPDKTLYGNSDPSDCDITNQLMLSTKLASEMSSFKANTNFSNACMKINDDMDTTVTKKIKLLRKELAKKGYKLIVKDIEQPEYKK